MAGKPEMISEPFGRTGALLGLVVGLGIICFAIYSFLPPASPRVYSITMLTCGILECLTCYFAIYRSRAAWSFALSLNFVGAVVFLFGATKVRDATGLHLAVSLLPSISFGLIGVLLTMASDEYNS
jgi:uncharacterized YccA/Bax inhibitor family protein